MNLLAIASRPSDVTEILDLAQALAARQHDVTLLYLHAESERAVHYPVLQRLKALDPQGGRLRVRDLDLDSLWVTDAPKAAPRPPSLSRSIKRRIARVIYMAHMWGRHLPKPVKRALHPVSDAVDLSVYMATGAWRQDLTRLQRCVPALGRLTSPAEVRRSVSLIAYYERALATFRQLIRDGHIDAVLIPEDIVGPVWPTSIKAAHDESVPAIVFPYTLANRDEPIQSLKHVPAFQARANRLAARFFPTWRVSEQGADIVRLPGAHVFAHEVLGIAPPDPWTMNSGFADAICVDSPAALDYFRAAGIPSEQLTVVGSVSQDVMFEQRRNRDAFLADLRGELRLEGTKPLLLVSGCPNQLAGGVPACDFKTFEEIAAFVGESLAPLGQHYHLVVRPHPNFPEFGALLDPYGFRTASVPTSRLVPLASLFVAFASATIRWAIACAVPTVNYDVFHYGYGEFSAASGVISMQDQTTFRESARSLVCGSAAYEALASRIEADSKRWSMMDGGGLSRIEDVIRRTSANRRAGVAATARPA
jgi:hypothetical protein